MAILLKPKAKEHLIDLVPDGSYRAKLTKINQFKNAYGDRLGFEFTLKDKTVDGLRVMRSTSTQLSASGKLVDVLRGILGRELTAAELSKGIDVEGLVGMECGVLVLQAKSKNGNTYPNVERIFPVAAQI
jgi:hypothetical protein